MADGIVRRRNHADGGRLRTVAHLPLGHGHARQTVVRFAPRRVGSGYGAAVRRNLRPIQDSGRLRVAQSERVTAFRSDYAAAIAAAETSGPAASLRHRIIVDTLHYVEEKHA